MLLGFALVLLSMFFFYLKRRARTLIGGSSFVVGRLLSFVCSTHGPPVTHLVAPSCALRGLRALGPVHPV
jgi:hypothetical protein